MKQAFKNFCVVLVLLVAVFSMVACYQTLTEEDFSFEITVNSETINQGESVEVEVVLKNLSGRRIKIVHSSSMLQVYIDNSGGVSSYDLRNSIFEKDGEIVGSETRGPFLLSGEYVITATAKFSIGQKKFNIASNSITLTVN